MLLRAITDRGELHTPQGRIAIGWLIVEDLVTVVILVLLPTIAPVHRRERAAEDGTDPLLSIALALGKAVLFAVLMIVAGARLVPKLLVLVANEGSKELFTLAVLALALGIAYVSASVFGVSFALGAFLAGAVVGESDMSHQAAADSIPLRDAFAVLFFVSVGMLLDPASLLAMPMAIVAVLILIVVGKGLFKFAFVLLFGHPLRVALTVSAGLAQVGEFSFILGTVGLSLGLLPVEGFQLIVAGALLSIALNPLLFRLADWLEPRLRDHPAMHRLVGHQAGELARLEPAADGEGGERLRLHAILCGYGQVGRMIARAMDRRGFTYVVITQQRGEVEQLRARGIAALYGDASNPELLREAQVESARVVIVAGDDAHVTHLIVDRARVLNPAVDFVVRTHSDEEVAQLRGLTPKVQAVHGQRELAVQMARYTLRRFGVNAAEAEAVAQGLRGRPAPAVEPVRAPSRWRQLTSPGAFARRTGPAARAASGSGSRTTGLSRPSGSERLRLLRSRPLVVARRAHPPCHEHGDRRDRDDDRRDGVDLRGDPEPDPAVDEHRQGGRPDARH